MRKKPIPTQQTIKRMAQNPIVKEMMIVTKVTLFIPPVELGFILAAVEFS